MQSKSIKDRADDQGTSRSVRLTAQTMDGSSSTDETQNNPVTNALARLEGVIETKISTLKRDLAIENEENLTRMAKRFKPTPKYEFKHDGNRQQHNHRSDVKEALQTAFDALVNSNFDRAKEALEEGMLLVDKRSKLIILADKYGWDFVKEYQRDEVASNSDDIKKCLKLVNSARVQKRSKVTRKLTPESTVGGVSSFMPHRSISVSPRSINPLLFRSSKQLFGPCHSCGRYGHYWRACPTRISAAAVANNRQLVAVTRSNSNNVSSV